MLWLRASLFVLASVPMVLANLTNLTGNVTCVPRIDPEVLSDLKFEDFAMPFGINTLNNYCRFLKDFYYCDDYLKEKAPLSNKAVQYLITARGYLMNFCDPENYFYQEYKRNEECFAEVLPFYYRCVDSTKDQQVPSFADTWPRDGSVEDCKRESRIVFCMANVMRRLCGKPDPGLYYLLVQKTTHFFEVHCVCPQLLDVRRHVSEMITELFRGKEGQVEKKCEEISRCKECI